MDEAVSHATNNESNQTHITEAANLLYGGGFEGSRLDGHVMLFRFFATCHGRSK